MTRNHPVREDNCAHAASFRPHATMTERLPIWAAILLSLSILALLTLIVGGPAIGWFAREVQYVLAVVAVIALAGGVIALWMARHDGHAFSRDRGTTD